MSYKNGMPYICYYILIFEFNLSDNFNNIFFIDGYCEQNG